MDNVKEVAVTWARSAVITEEGDLYVWGYNSYGQVGNGESNQDDVLYCSLPVKIMDHVQSVTLTDDRTAAITEDGSLYMWGVNSYGQLGNGDQDNYDNDYRSISAVPVKVMDHVSSIALSDWTSAAITEDGTLYMWGRNYESQIGTGYKSGFEYRSVSFKKVEESDVTSPTKVMEHVRTVALSKTHSAAVTDDGSLYLWGENSKGQIGNGEGGKDEYDHAKVSETPAKIMDNVQKIVLSYEHSAAITEDGSLYLWGANAYGEIGKQGYVNENTWVYYGVMSPFKCLDRVESVFMSNFGTTAVTKDGSVYMWGQYRYYQSREKYTPSKVLSTYVAVPVCDNYYGYIDLLGNQYILNITGSSCADVLINIPEDDASSPTLQSAPPSLTPLAMASTQTTSFDDLEPGASYYLYSVADRNAAEPLGSNNLLYINQYTADENGCIKPEFTPTREVADAETFVMLLPVPASEPESEEQALGDVDGNGSIDASDAAEVLIAAAMIGVGGNPDLTDAQQSAADVNADGSINAADAAVILQYAAAVGAGQSDAKIEDF